MPKKQAIKSEAKELRTEVQRLQASLKKAEAKATRWKGEAAKHKSAAAAMTGKVTKLEKLLAKVTDAGVGAAADTPPTRTQTPASVTVTPAAPRDPTAPRAAKPDASWTVPQLRQEARLRNVAYSGKTKAELIAALI